MAIPHNKAVIDLNPTNGLGDTIEAQSKEKKKFGKRDAKTALYHLAIWLPLTAFIIAVIIKGQGKPGYVFAIVIYVLITLRFLAQHISMSQLIYGMFVSDLCSRRKLKIASNEI